ncbi:MAG: alkaline phosphatase family protein [Thermoplasmata archaeon]|nr:alkaline phosphatase family protein [Thermoplasmata archaeon]
MRPHRRRFLVLGLDGGTFDLLTPWMESGELPFLASLVRGGASAPLASVYPPKTIPAWYSFATGQDPGSLGIFGFTEPDGGPGRSRLVQTFRPAEAVWDHLSRVGVPVGVLNFPLRAGYPLNGFLVPGMISENPPTFPETLRGTLERALGEPYVPELPAYRASDRATWIGQATHGVEQRARAAEILCKTYGPDFLFVLFRETDRVQHQHWSELAGPHAEVGHDLREFWRAVDVALARVDGAFRALGTPAITLVISDHGHGAARSDFFTNRWLAEEGYLAFRGSASGLRRRLVSSSLLAAEKWGPTRRLVHPVVDRLRGGPRREAFGRLVTGESSFEAMASRIDWAKTVAFSYPVPEGIYLNRYNRSLTAERGAEAVAEIKHKLRAYPGARVEVFEPKDIYRGHNLENAPALLLKVDELETELRMDFSYAKPMLRERPGFFYGTGVHRMNGILVAAGDGIRAQRRAAPFSLLDVAPTILEGMGLPVPASMVGHSFAPWLGLGPN